METAASVVQQTELVAKVKELDADHNGNSFDLWPSLQVLPSLDLGSGDGALAAKIKKSGLSYRRLE